MGLIERKAGYAARTMRLRLRWGSRIGRAAAATAKVRPPQAARIVAAIAANPTTSTGERRA